MSHEEAEKKIKKLGGIDKLYRIKFEADYFSLKLAYDGAKRLYGEPLSDEVYERVKFELHIMKTMGFPATSSSCRTSSTRLRTSWASW